jgi:hypothetical protein
VGFFVVEVTPLLVDVLVGFCQENDRFAATMAPLLAPGHPPLAAAQLRLGLAIVCGGDDGLPVGAVGGGVELTQGDGEK